MLKNKGRFLILVAIALSLTSLLHFQTAVQASIEAVCGAAGTLDPSFGGTSMIVTPVGPGDDHARSTRIQADGKIIVAGDTFNSTTQKYDFAVVRYNPDGTVDTTFDGDGKATASIGTLDDTVTAAAIQADGRIVVVGGSFSGSNYDVSLVRFNTNGSLDTTFGSGGKVITPVNASTDDVASSVAITAAGKIVIAGYTQVDSSALPPLAFVVARYNSDGSLDNTFGTGGKATTTFGTGTSAAAFSVAAQSDGKIVAGGVVSTTTANSIALARYNTDGTLDNTFGTGGKVTTSIGGIDDAAYSIAIQPDGKIVAAGYSATATGTYTFAVVRYNTNGSLDTSFDGDGIATTSILGVDDTGSSVAIAPDGKIVVGGYAFDNSNYDFAVVRYNANGSLDLSFNAGKGVTAVQSTDTSRSVAIQTDGSVILAGSTQGATGLDYTVIRYFGSGCPSIEGDINRANPLAPGSSDGRVDGDDLTWFDRFANGLNCPQVSPNEFQKMDVAPFATNGDGFIGMDRLQLERFIAGLDPKVPGAGPVQPPTPFCTGSSRPEADVLAALSGRKAINLLVRIGSVASRAGSAVAVPVEMRLAGGEITSQFTVHFDPRSLTISDVPGTNVNPDVLLGDLPMGARVIVNTSGIADGDIGILINFNGAGTYPATTAAAGTRTVLSLRFMLTSNRSRAGGVFPITFNDNVFITKTSNVLGGSLPLRGGLQGGSVTIVGGPVETKRNTKIGPVFW